MAFWTLIVNYSLQQQIISQSDCDMGWKVDFIQLGMTSSMTGLRKRSKDFPQPNLHPKRSWSLFSGLLPVWPTTAFWILVKPLHLRSMLSKSMRFTENWKVCSYIDQQNGPNFYPQQCLTTCHTTNTSKVEWIGLQSFASSAILTWRLTKWLPLLQASWQLFAGKNASTANMMQKFFSKSSSNPKAWIFILQE